MDIDYDECQIAENASDLEVLLASVPEHLIESPWVQGIIKIGNEVLACAKAPKLNTSGCQTFDMPESCLEKQ